MSNTNNVPLDSNISRDHNIKGAYTRISYDVDVATGVRDNCLLQVITPVYYIGKVWF